MNGILLRRFLCLTGGSGLRTGVGYECVGVCKSLCVVCEGVLTWSLVREESGVSVVLVELVSVILNVTLSPWSSLRALLMGVAHLRSDRRLRPDCPPELGGVGVG